MFQIFEIRGKRFEYSNNIRSPKFSNLNPNIRDSRKKIRIRIYSIISDPQLITIGIESMNMNIYNVNRETFKLVLKFIKV